MVVTVPDVYAEISAPASVPAGAVVSTAVRFGNQGGTSAEGVIYIVELDPGLSGVSCAGATCSYNPATGLVTVMPVNRVKDFEKEFIGLMRAQNKQVMDNFRAGKFEDADVDVVKKFATELASKY